MRVLLVLLLLVAGCSGARRIGAAQGREVDTDDPPRRAKRTFHLYRPASLPSSAPLVVMLHGGFGNGEQAERSYGWDAEADKGRFLVAYPDGVNRAWATGGGCCGMPGRRTSTTSPSSACRATIGRELPLDRRPRVRDRHLQRRDAVLPAGLRHEDLRRDRPRLGDAARPCPHPAPISVIHVHGTADHNIPYNGGQGERRRAQIDGPAVPGLVAGWRKTDHCAAPVTTVHAPGHHLGGHLPGRPRGRADHHRRRRPPVARRRQQPVLERVLHLDPPSKALDATDVIWKFFAAHPG